MAASTGQGISTTAFTAGFDSVLKDFFEGSVRKHLNTKTTLLQYVERSQRSWTGRQILFPVNLRRTSGVGARGEDGTLPKADRQRYDDCKISAKFLYGRIEITGPVIEASRGDRGAFASALRSEIEGMRRDLRDDLNRQLFGNPARIDDGSLVGKTGVLALVKTGVNHATQTVDNPGTRYIKPGMNVVIAASDGTFRGAQKVLSVSSDNTQFTMDDAINSTTDDVVVRGDSTGSHSLNNEVVGLSDIIANTADQAGSTFQQIDASTASGFDEWNATNLSNNGNGNRPLSLELMQLAIDSADEVGGAEPTLIMGHHSMRREYINLLTSDVRYSPEQLRGGFQKLTYAGGTNPMPIEFDKHCTYNLLYFINTADLKWYVQKDWAWADRDGSSMSRVPDKDVWESFISFYGNLGTERRNTHVVLNELNASNLIF